MTSIRKFLLAPGLLFSAALHAANPIITDVFTADPAPLVAGDTVYLYCGQDEAPNDKHQRYVMNRWLCYSTKDMKTWAAEGSPLAPKDFTWAVGDAWASQVIERNGKYYWYAAVEHQGIITFKGADYFFSHNGSMQHGTKLGSGSSFRRSVCIDYLYYNPDGSMQRVAHTTEGVDAPPNR